MKTKINNDTNVTIYRKDYVNLTKNPISALILNQMIYWYKIKKGQKFFKFIEPCKHPLYIAGDSWTEELGISRARFMTAFNKIATKITSGKSKKNILEKEDITSLILYWTDSSRLTWYLVNQRLLDKYKNLNYLVNDTSAVTYNREYNKEYPEINISQSNFDNAVQTNLQKIEKHVSTSNFDDSTITDIQKWKIAYELNITPPYVSEKIKQVRVLLDSGELQKIITTIP